MYNYYFKPLIDKILALTGIVFLLPVFIIISLLIFFDDGLPVIYKQLRVGKNAKGFYIYKFRTMIKNADKVGPLSTSNNDNRITKTGKFLRNTSLDELPQLFNVLNGTMSLIGYRPDVFRDEDDYNDIKYTLKPGVTGYAQVNGRSCLNSEQKLEWEQKYVKDISFMTDIKILLKTIVIVLFRKGVN